MVCKNKFYYGLISVIMTLAISFNVMAKSSDKCIIRGDLSGLDGKGWVYLKDSWNDHRIVDSTRYENGKFELRIKNAVSIDYKSSDDAEYKDAGLEILGVSFDYKLKQWKEFCRSNEMVWPNICDPKSHMSEIFKLYGIQGIPDNILIDCRTGIIIRRDLRGENLMEELGKLLGK